LAAPYWVHAAGGCKVLRALVPISFGELIDKITILEIKSERMKDPIALDNVRRELSELHGIWSEVVESGIDISDLRARLKKVNEALWDIEDRIRVKESLAEFDGEFIELARSVYLRNDERSRYKRKINTLLGSDLVEEKSYADYRRKP
jgi:hypothetical protein